ncbi:UDP-galactose transporter related protein [Phaffia rhodozyma]|uniref:UDP-galactose transporter homolog 1 n=1 Tax=Phaffia rhodozyma TaxID=264483 RepID=A0A0F7SNF5_PHARH|nr:UDP-galactose transporter related protein [Phaffia rhodozyma]
MPVLKFGVCCGGVYAMFLIWAIAQERLSVPFPSTLPHEPPARFKSILVLNTTQALASLLFSFIYISIRRPSSPSSTSLLGLNQPNGDTRGLLGAFAKVAMLNTSAGPFGFASLRHISYPTMVLGKSCKLVPVLFMNFILYRRKFPPHKYLVVTLVTLGISLFMLLGAEGASNKHSSHKGSSAVKTSGESLVGLGLLVINLLIDGATNSGQDEIFRRWKVTGQQMMFFMSFFTLLISLPLILLPLPPIPLIHPTPSSQSELSSFLSFLSTHPDLLKPLVGYSVTGALGQLFIFETLGEFGSLTLVMVTVTRKLFTMMLSVVLFDHQLTLGQWLGAAVVFLGIGVEAWAKITESKSKKGKKATVGVSQTNGHTIPAPPAGSGKVNGKKNL